MVWQIPLSNLGFGPEELQAVHDVLASKWLSMGQVTETFAQQFAALLDVPYTVAVSSATAARRQHLTARYHHHLRAMYGVTVPSQHTRAILAYNLFPRLLDNQTVRTHVMQYLGGKGIQASMHSPPIHQFSLYRQRYAVPPGHLPHTEAVGKRQLTLPLYATMTDEQVDMLCPTLEEALQS